MCDEYVIELRIQFYGFVNYSGFCSRCAIEGRNNRQTITLTNPKLDVRTRDAQDCRKSETEQSRQSDIYSKSLFCWILMTPVMSMSSKLLLSTLYKWLGTGRYYHRLQATGSLSIPVSTGRVNCMFVFSNRAWTCIYDLLCTKNKVLRKQ